MLPILNKDCIVTDVSAAEKNDIIREMAGCLDRAGYLSDVEQFYQDVLEREKVFSTYIGYQIGLPHGKSGGVNEAGLSIAKLPEEILWDEESGEKVSLIIMIAVQAETDNNLHLQILSKLSRLLIHDDFRDDLRSGDKNGIYELIQTNLKEFDK